MQNAGRVFMEMTRYIHLTASDQQMGITPPPLEKPYPEDGTFIQLPMVDRVHDTTTSLLEVIEARRSIRTYSRESLALEELAYLLWSTQGIMDSRAPYFMIEKQH